MKDVEIFLGGTCNGSKWREELIPQLKVKYFNPVVEDWTDEAQIIELQKRKSCNHLLYVITPKMSGFFSIAELTEDSVIRPHKTHVIFLDEDEDLIFNNHQKKSIKAILNLVKNNGAKTYKDLDAFARKINSVQRWIDHLKS